jgi:hypothetical protein
MATASAIQSVWVEMSRTAAQVSAGVALTTTPTRIRGVMPFR